MKTRSLFLVFIFSAAAISTAAQSRVVTNEDLAKYREARVKAETDLRENYAKLGFPSPEELERRRQRSAQETAEYAERIRAANLAIEQEDARRRSVRTVYAPPVYFSNGDTGYGDFGYVYLNGRYYRQRVRQFRQGYTQPGYFAGGQFWPTGSATPPRPFRVTRRP